MDPNVRDIGVQIFKIGGLLFGNFTLKSGKKSPVYCDMRSIISFPNLMKNLGEEITKLLHNNNVDYDLICGVPYTGIPIATFVSVKVKKPLSLRRKEQKSYGTKKMIEGSYNRGDKCLVIEDVITTGGSVLQTIKDLEDVGLVVKDIVVILVRQLSGVRYLKEKGYNVHCLFTLEQLVEILKEEKLLKPEEETLAEGIYSEEPETLAVRPIPRQRLLFSERASQSVCSVAIKLFALMSEKKTNLCLAADLTSMEEILKLATLLGPYICILKLHLDIVADKKDSHIAELHRIAKEQNFLIMEDRKLSDIGNTVCTQYSRISKWTGLVTAHSLPGYGILEGIKRASSSSISECGVFLVAEMSCAGNLITPEYIEKTVQLGESYPSIVAGFVCQSPTVFKSPGFIQLTPGVSLQETGDGLCQQYKTPEEVVTNNFADIAVVGRAIISASDPVSVAKQYKERLWNAYLKRIES